MATTQIGNSQQFLEQFMQIFSLPQDLSLYKYCKPSSVHNITLLPSNSVITRKLYCKIVVIKAVNYFIIEFPENRTPHSLIFVSMKPEGRAGKPLLYTSLGRVILLMVVGQG